MVFAHLTRYWLGLRQPHYANRLLTLLRSARVLLHYRDHAALCQLGVYRNVMLRTASADPFHHLSRRAYLLHGLSVGQRVQCMLSHYRFEETTYDAAYKNAIYGAAGLNLWQQQLGTNVFQIRLELSACRQAQGELTLALLADGALLHQLAFTWIEGSIVGVPVALLPLVAPNERLWSDGCPAHATFARSFPNNSPSFFCFAALQGLARALGIEQVAAVKATAQRPEQGLSAAHAANPDDGFWKALGGIALAGPVWLVALPFYLKPLADMPSRHRKRAAQRRAHWRAIGDATRATLQRHLLHARAHPAPAAPLPQAAQV